mmetsp:Transcript_6430/g.18987  ORF Transcript_6430/g.18987 Transcript_6430/m.18987 type:complete len:219 (+) Transcript_6430:311-967(+)
MAGFTTRSPDTTSTPLLRLARIEVGSTSSNATTKLILRILRAEGDSPSLHLLPSFALSSLSSSLTGGLILRTASMVMMSSPMVTLRSSTCTPGMSKLTKSLPLPSGLKDGESKWRWRMWRMAWNLEWWPWRWACFHACLCLLLLFLLHPLRRIILIIAIILRFLCMPWRPQRPWWWRRKWRILRKWCIWQSGICSSSPASSSSPLSASVLPCSPFASS